MEQIIMKSTLPALAIGAAAIFAAVFVHASEATYSCTNGRGETTLTNVPTSAHCERLLSYTPSLVTVPAAAPASGAAPLPESASAARQSAVAPVVHSRDTRPVSGRTRPARQAGRRNAAIQEMADAAAQGQPGKVQNRAVNRRYLMIGRADYIKTYGSNP